MFESLFMENFVAELGKHCFWLMVLGTVVNMSSFRWYFQRQMCKVGFLVWVITVCPFYQLAFPCRCVHYGSELRIYIFIKV
jgi:hypothetical protein